MSHRFKLLTVDDFKPFRRLLSSFLPPSQFEIVGEAADGLEGVRLAEERQPDLILLDIGLPELHGLEVARQIQTVSPSSKVLFVSQESSADVVLEALRLGRGYVLKQRAQSDLLLAIEAVLRGERFVSPTLTLNDDKDAQPQRRHDVLFCSDDATIVESFADFIATALSAGNPAMARTTEARRESLLRRLRAQGVEIDAAIQRGTFMALDVTEPADRAQILQMIQALRNAAFQAGSEHPRVAACGEYSGRLWAEGKVGEAMQVEELCNELVESQDVDILCLYPLPDGQDDATSLENICAQHTRVTTLR